MPSIQFEADILDRWEPGDLTSKRCIIMGDLVKGTNRYEIIILDYKPIEENKG